ncbi:sigma-70 family RNA polymerase sigma factor [Qingshengfaniella alkalisoli]|uniref:Sigma-70 family RNA polymerase sigma factor n=1 Tax=Qingshengfaniella alkalisoli TaxID=2599296 RepID=A0A5B8IWN4_9RHOB|nr:sigma-70 family RNA polymerase sigma factor [Qingshengfaniella alkalisoli]QDY70552.1 sigma-70 family RNA polymerase sigma factor [Qingshengfaniella alkalisoli]
MTNHEDIEQLIAKVALGDRTAFASLYDATSGKLFAVCLRILKNRSSAEDALQDVYMRVWHKADRYAVTGHSPMTWLITVARNLAIDRLRATKAKHVDLDSAGELVETRPDPEATSIAASEQRRISACFDELPSDRAAAVRAAYLDGATYQTLAARFDVPLNTMRTWLRRSLISLKECLSR